MSVTVDNLHDSHSNVTGYCSRKKRKEKTRNPPSPHSFMHPPGIHNDAHNISSHIISYQQNLTDGSNNPPRHLSPPSNRPRKMNQGSDVHLYFALPPRLQK
ncbi:hypothetical protein BDW42DRAFT_88905 [Aspergillus taichungensis]|uniref:Uncharacterized protein n=1 Tax=Aspergillus taichungensis TaxID=482145 RepID=A0A2J5HWH0_9EURO|nr:hypothetical protein BDW42DRAFT_88905 [Aspergillus taichungensis]